MEINKIYNMDCLEGLRQMQSDSVDLCVTSPPYDNSNMDLNTIYKGDAKELILQIPDNSIDFVLTDPPYLIDIGGGGNSPLGKRSRKLKDSISFIANGFDYNFFFEQFLRICKIPNIIIFCSNRQISRTMSFFEEKGLVATLLIWQKSNPMPTGNNVYISECEFAIYVRGKNATFNTKLPIEWKRKIYTSSCHPDGKLHPTQKPLELLRRYILIHSNENDVVLDPFMGSGSTAIACIKENRKFIGFEIVDRYVQIANERIIQELSQKKLF